MKKPIAIILFLLIILTTFIGCNDKNSGITAELHNAATNGDAKPSEETGHPSANPVETVSTPTGEPIEKEMTTPDQGDFSEMEIITRETQAPSETEPSAGEAKKDSCCADKAGDIIQFGGYKWRILDVTDGKALIITEGIIERREYHERFENTTWANCDLRQYLNGEFYDSFSEKDKVKIIQVTNQNPDNPWYGTHGGPDTQDHIFLLSVDEAVKYFGDSGKLTNRPIGDDRYEWLNEYPLWYIDDEFNDNRKAGFASGVENYGNDTGLWWLRTPGWNGDGGGDSDFPWGNWPLPYGTAFIDFAGGINVQGHITGDALAGVDGVRPALWLTME